MKRIYAILLLCAFVNNYPLPQHGALTGEIFGSNFIGNFRISFATDKALYTNGGLTINYPITFINTPIVNISIQLLGAFDPAITYVPLVLTNLTTSATIVVNRITYDSNTQITTVEEAATNEVAIHIWSVDQ